MMNNPQPIKNEIDTIEFDFRVNVIIPVKHRDEYNICDRLRMKSKLYMPKNFEFIIIDYGSESLEANLIKETCDEIGFTYHYATPNSNLWNASAARNIGLNLSKCDYVLFEDVDLYHKNDFYINVNIEISNLLETGDWPFFVIPVAYLTEEGSQIALNGIDDYCQSKLISEVYKPNSDLIVHHAPASSFMVCKYHDAISIGGYDESFEGWGFEDSDFWLRLLRNVEIEKPRDFFRLDTRNYSKQVNWRGWRSLFRIYADLVANKGIYSFHIWHPIAEHRSVTVRERNHKIFKANTERYSKNNFSYTPLTNPNKKKKLFLSKNPHSFNRDVFKVLDNPILIEEKFITIYNLSDIINQNNIECIIFNNPYGDEHRLAIYIQAKKIGIKTYVIERGSLPWSIYIDENGFCCESTSYFEDKWKNIPLDDLKRTETLNYIDEIKTSGSTLEPQGQIIGGANLKRKLFGESEAIKILFVALQSPSDTTTRYFCGDVISYDNFINEIKLLPHLLPENWKVIVKNHPLSLDKFNSESTTLVDEYHIGDILECCDAVALLNSGVGIISQLYDKHVFTFGQAHYSCEELNSKVESAQHLADKLISDDYKFNKEKSIKFISYLINDFYSFATWERKERKHTDKANLSISVNIKYNIIRVFNEGELKIKPANIINIKESMLFDRYRLDDYLEKKQPEALLKPITNELKLDRNVISSSPQQFVLKNRKKGSLSRKIKKLAKNPKLFFIDALRNRVS
ncbi:galactosyltransferase-related protein [Pantoea sp. GL120224-02]|uniref:galactosyltransferase-related protein n=1 Tax=Pantoea sp. GL120224-02 TaxID=1378084 RepID=UPI000BDBC849|nr:galactosyltransferase-related protein [Pantoea sp. GL120224-02]SNY65950.1 Predicted glycosyltransferase involved in capsule biosynthesis [Pantoea sp. GL120224-02]